MNKELLMQCVDRLAKDLYKNYSEKMVMIKTQTFFEELPSCPDHILRKATDMMIKELDDFPNVKKFRAYINAVRATTNYTEKEPEACDRLWKKYPRSLPYYRPGLGRCDKGLVLLAIDKDTGTYVFAYRCTCEAGKQKDPKISVIPHDVQEDYHKIKEVHGEQTEAVMPKEQCRQYIDNLFHTKPKDTKNAVKLGDMLK